MDFKTLAQAMPKTYSQQANDIACDLLTASTDPLACLIQYLIDLDRAGCIIIKDSKYRVQEA